MRLLFILYIGYGPILLNLMQVQWMTTQSPSWCLGAVGVNVGVVTHQHFGITDGCYLTPFIYTALCDAALIVFTYISYKLARYYSFPGQYDDDDDEIEESMTYDDYAPKNRRTATINTRRIYGQPTNTTTTISTRGNNITRGPPPSSYAHAHATKGGKKASKGGRAKKKASISLTEPAHWKTNNKPRRSGKTAPSPAYIVEKSPTFIPHQSIDPEYWQKRKSTYEKNYS